MRHLLIFIVFTFFYGCQNQAPSEKEAVSNEITKKAAEQIAKETGLIPCGFGGQAMDEIKMLALAFDYRHELDIDSGRRLLLTALERYKSAINADERIRPYLVRYPFEAKNIEIRIFIQNEDGSDFGTDKLSVITVMGNVLKYKITTPDGHGLKTIYQETYEEALAENNSRTYVGFAPTLRAVCLILS